jgi:hypothetical protein
MDEETGAVTAARSGAWGRLAPVESEWYEVSVKGERRLWRQPQDGLDDCASDDTKTKSREDSQEERNKWTLLGSLRWINVGVEKTVV